MIRTPPPCSPIALLQDLGAAVAVLGAFLLLIGAATAWALPLVAMGSMTLTLYSAHLIALIVEVHWGQRLLWFLVHLGWPYSSP